MSRLGYRVRNDHVVPVPVARSRTSLTDAAIDFAAIPIAASRVWRADTRRNAPATLSIAAVLAVLLALTIGHGSGGIVRFALAARRGRRGPARPPARSERQPADHRRERRRRVGVARPPAHRPREHDRARGPVQRRRRDRVAAGAYRPPRAARGLRRGADRRPARPPAHRVVDRGGRGRRRRIRARVSAASRGHRRARARGDSCSAPRSSRSPR